MEPQAASPPPPVEPKPRRRLGWKGGLLIGCLGCAGLITVAVFAAILALGVGVQTGQVPDSRALSEQRLSPRIVEQLRSLDIIEADERVLYFYSAAMLDIESDGNLFTDRRVISYAEHEGELYIYEASWDEIEELEFDNTDSWLDDSTITVHRTDGEWFLLLVGNEGRGDDDFYRKLRKTWRRAVEDDGAS